MKPQPEPSTQEVLAGLVERVTFHNVENGFCVLRAKARGHRELVTVIGHAAIISAGEWITATGDWVNDRTHGQQFKARFLRTSIPTSADGIEKYLSSGMIRGVGPAYAKKLVRAFGEKVFDVIEATPLRLREVDGIGPVRAASILAAWAEQKAVREIMVFLHSHGVGTARAVRIFKTYGADAIQVMTENPYCLARDIRGIGFKTADAIAMKLGIEKTAMVRVRAGISYALTEAMDEGLRLADGRADPSGRDTAGGASRAHSHCARSRAAAGHGGRRPSWRNALRISGGPAPRGADDCRAADAPGQRHAALALD
jgi:exodeoxyribonuclease V alpha subunit